MAYFSKQQNQGGQGYRYNLDNVGKSEVFHLLCDNKLGWIVWNYASSFIGWYMLGPPVLACEGLAYDSL